MAGLSTSLALTFFFFLKKKKKKKKDLDCSRALVTFLNIGQIRVKKR